MPIPKTLPASPSGDSFDQYYLGWAFPPKDYAKWAELVNRWMKHALAKYGRSEVSHGIGRFGMNPTSATGVARPMNITSYTTSPPTP